MPGESRYVVPLDGGRLSVESGEDFYIWRDGSDGRSSDERHLGVRVSVPHADGRKTTKLPSIGVALDRDGQELE